jgi:hypothetical protein
MQQKNLLAIVICFSFFILTFLSVEGVDWKNLKYSGSAITTDELAHITSGYYYFKTNRYFLNPEHPPLVKDISAIPLLFLNQKFPDISSANLADGYAWNNYPPKEYIYSENLEKINDPWDLGRVFLFNPQNNADLIVFWSRFAVITFNCIFLFLLYVFVVKIWNKKTALISLFLLVFSQFDIANGSLVTMDFMSSILQMATLALFAIWLKKNTTNYFFLTSLFLSLSLLSKFSSIIILPVMFLGGFVYTLIIKNSAKEIRKYILRYTFISLLSLSVISVVYAFHVSKMQASDILYQLNHYLPTNIYELVITYVPNYLFTNLFSKGIIEYIFGVFMVFGRMANAYQKIYFMGSTYGSEGAGALYFPILYLTKLPVGLLVLIFSGIIAFLFSLVNAILKGNLWAKFKVFISNPLSFLLLTFIYVFTILTLSSNLQIGLRHILPIIVASTLLIAKFMGNQWNATFFKFFKSSYFFVVILALIMFSTLLSFPYYLSYYNYFGGGTDNGYKIATDSNYDWGGQDIKELARWIIDNNVQKVYLDLSGSSFPPEYYLGSAYEKFDIEKQDLPSSGSIIAISASDYPLNNNEKIKFLNNNLVTRLGKTIFVFRMP